MVAAEKRYQVFVSSTYLDLKEERQAIMAALLTLDAIPAGMELFPAINATAWALIKQVIDDCDYYLVVIGGKYGSIDPECDLSYTEKEYDYAVAEGKPVMAFLYRDIQQLTGAKIELNSSVAEKLAKFRTKIESGSHVKYWNSADQLAGLVALSLPAQIKLFPAVGWVRADKVTSAESLEEIERLRKRIAELEQKADTVAHTPPPGTAELQSGDDTTELAITTVFRYQIPKELPSRSRLVIERIFTWDEIFSIVSPSLLNECEQGQMHEVINTWMEDHLWLDDVFPGEVTEAFVDAELNIEDIVFSDHTMSISPEEFNGILIQLVALGLVEEGTRKRSVTDTGTYWKLTPYGKNRTLQLMAKKKVDPRAPSGGEAVEEPSGDS